MRSLIVCLATISCASGCVRLNPDGGADLGPPDGAPPAGDLGAAASQLVAGGELQSVTTDQAWLAYLDGVHADSGVDVGALTVASLTGGATRVIADDAWSAGFGGTATLTYLTHPTRSTDANSTAIYGTWALWKPAQAAGIPLSTGLALARATPPSDAWALLWDVTTPSVTASGPVELVRFGDCTATACVPVTVAASVTHVAAMSASPDGRFGAFVVNLGASPASYDVYLVDEAKGSARRVSAAGPSTVTSFAPDGNRLALVGPGGALVVVDTASGQPAAWAALPAGARTQQLAFADAQTLLVRALGVGASASDVWLTTVASATPLATGVATMAVPRNSAGASGTARWAFVAPSLANGVGPIVAYDLDAVAAQPITVAAAASPSSLAVSGDQMFVRVLDAFDPTTQSGRLLAVSLPDGSASAVGESVGLGAPAFAGAHTLFFIDGNGTLGAWLDGTTVSYAAGVDQYRLRGANLYFGVHGGDPLHGLAPGVYVTAQ